MKSNLTQTMKTIIQNLMPERADVLENPERPPAPPSAETEFTEAAFHQENHAPRGRQEKDFVDHILVAENRETEKFTAKVSFELSGAALNGCSRFDSHVGESLSRPDHLLSRLFSTMECGTIIEFVLGGGGSLEFRWRINGCIYDAVSRDDALSKAAALRQHLQLLLGSEPVFRFGTVVWANEETADLDEIHGIRLEPMPFRLDVSQTTMIGFGSAPANREHDRLCLSLTRPSKLIRSFNSVAEAVALSPAPLLIHIRLRSFEIPPAQQKQIATALAWARRNTTALERQLIDQSLDATAVRSVETTLRRWAATHQGVEIKCKIFSNDHESIPFLTMIGADVFGSSVRALPESPGSTGIDPGAELHLEGCLPSGSTLPPLFPTFASISRTRIRRHFNLAPPDLDREGVLLGAISEEGIQSVCVHQAARSRHLYVLGATGTGKSTLLANMIHQDIQEGRGVCLLDPHGDLYDQIVENLPLNRAKDVVMFNPAEAGFAPGLNVLECNGPHRDQQVNFAINELLKTFDRMYNMHECGGPMFETYFRNALLLLLESDLPEVTIMELSLVFESKEYRQFLLGRCHNPMVVGFWKNIAERAGGEGSVSNIAPYIICKLNSFTYNALIRPILGQAKSTIDFREVMDRQRILLIKLPKGLLGEFDSQLLGTFILSRIFSAAMGRANVPDNKRPAFHLYVDEFQNFVNDGVAFMLAEARKYGLHLTMANQNLSQLAASAGRHNIVDAVLGNVGSLIAFRVGPPDAEKLRLYTEPEFGSTDLQGLPNYHAVARLLTVKGPTRPFIFGTLPRNWRLPRTRVNPIVWQLREQAHTRPVEEVEAAISARRNLAKVTTPEGGRKNQPTSPIRA